MVKLDKIYTRGGDSGQTSLGNGQRVSKTDARVVTMGSVDELNCFLGEIGLTLTDDATKQHIQMIQNDLFDMGADLCMPNTESEYPILRLDGTQIAWLEGLIDDVNQHLSPLTSFILPAGTACGVACHKARAVARRAERDILVLMQTSPDYVNPDILKYLNRLSDYLFVLARMQNEKGAGDILWIPAGNRTKFKDAS